METGSLAAKANGKRPAKPEWLRAAMLRRAPDGRVRLEQEGQKEKQKVKLK